MREDKVVAARDLERTIRKAKAKNHLDQTSVLHTHKMISRKVRRHNKARVILFMSL